MGVSEAPVRRGEVGASPTTICDAPGVELRVVLREESGNGLVAAAAADGAAPLVPPEVVVVEDAVAETSALRLAGLAALSV